MDTAHTAARRSCRRTAGFSLPELMVVMALIAVLLAAAVPSFGAMTDTVRLNALQSDLLAHLQLARSEAIKRAARVAVCKSADKRRCATAGGWEQGWIVFFDANNDGVRDAAETLVQSGDGAVGGLLASGNQNVARYVSFDSDGEARMASGAFQAGTITMCRASAGPVDARQIVINAFGRPRVQKSTVASCA